MPLPNYRAAVRQWAALPLRLIVGYGFIAHGYAKAMNGPERFAAALHALGVPASHSMAWVTIVCELLGGLAVLVGAWIPVVSVPLSAILLVAAITVHLPYGFSSIKLREVTSAGPQFGPPVTKPTSCTSRHLPRWCSGGQGRSHSINCELKTAAAYQTLTRRPDDHPRRSAV